MTEDLMWAPAPGWLPAGVRVYAIGDAHGCAGRLAEMHHRISTHAAASKPAKLLLVHLGDYVDRGPDSAGVIALLRAPVLVPGAESVSLMGNHEQMMLAALDAAADDRIRGFWLDNGGAATLASYGADAEDSGTWSLVPAGDRGWLRRLRPSLALGGYFFAHAGVRPDLPLDRQEPVDLAWIREPFLSWQGTLPAVVVHGHTPVRAPEVRSHRIGVDTGAVFGGALTCAVLEAERIGFLTV
ncbi:metallophosphoesterase family protein [Roseomonas sp. AR75]|uniref:metallophosphoesterase family protein n=1 Tax=Roseomonas sp. AR75 TaxID=2562311 RepID=UPI0010C13C26|nr:metallophosphoesterase family protein [Roseomonas sp. AR75]